MVKGVQMTTPCKHGHLSIRVSKGTCYECQKLAAKRYQESKRLTPHFRANQLWQAAKDRCTKTNTEFSLTLRHVMKGIVEGRCAATGLPLNLFKNADRLHNPYGPSLDRINPGGPYNDKNVRVVCQHFNIMKGALPDRELLRFCEAFVKNYN